MFRIYLSFDKTTKKNVDVNGVTVSDVTIEVNAKDQDEAMKEASVFVKHTLPGLEINSVQIYKR